MKIPKPIIIGGIIVIIIILIIIFSSVNKTPGEYDRLAKCLTENGVKMYGAYWCSHCEAQKEMFGNSFKYVDYVECSLPNNNGQTIACKNANIKAYPTWEFSNGERAEGELSFAELSERSNCELDITASNN